MSATQQTLAQLIRSKNPGTYDDMDDMTLESKVLAKYPQYSDLPRTQAAPPRGTPPDANAQAKQILRNIPQFTSPAAGREIQDPRNEYMRQSGQVIGQTAAGMATGGLFPVVKGAGLLRNTLPFLGRVGTSGAAMGAGTLAGGGTTQEAKGAAEGGVIAQPIAEGASAVLPWMAKGLKNAAVSQYQRALAPTTKINKAIAQEITPELINRGAYGSLEGLEKTATQKAGEIRPQLNSEYQQLEQATPKIAGAGDKVIQDLEAAKNQYMAGGQIADPAGVNAISGVQNIVKQYGSDVSPTTLRELRQVFENPVAQAGGFAGADLSTKFSLNAREAASNSIRRVLNSSPSDIGALNREVSFWLDVQKVTRESGLRRTGQEGGLMRVLSPLGTGLAASTTGLQFGAERGLEAGAATALTTAAYQIMRSPAWRTMSAVGKDRLARALASGDLGAVSALASRVGAANLQGRQSSQPPNQPPSSQLPFLPQGQPVQ